MKVGEEYKLKENIKGPFLTRPPKHIKLLKYIGDDKWTVAIIINKDYDHGETTLHGDEIYELYNKIKEA